MTMRSLLLLLPLALLAAACSSDQAASCDTTGGLPLNASAPWPKFRADMANSGNSDSPKVSVGVRATQGEASARWIFPAPPTPGVGPIAISPIVGPGDQGDDQVYLLAPRMDGSSLLQTYVIDGPDGDLDRAASIFIPLNLSVNSTPTLMQENHLMIALGDGSVREFDPEGSVLRFASLGGLIGASPALDFAGTVYIGADPGTFAGVCANSAFVFIALTGGTQSTAAVFNDDPTNLQNEIIVIAGNDGSVQGVNYLGQQLWLSYASARIQAAVVLDVERQLVYIADNAGRVFAFRLIDGTPCPDFTFATNSPISASPALGTNALYVATANTVMGTGDLYALNLGEPTTDAGQNPCDAVDPAKTQVELQRWVFAAGGPIRSSPAVASCTDTDTDTQCAPDVIVFGADDGILYAVQDGEQPTELWRYSEPSHIPFGRSSPALGSDGTVYIGSESGRLYAIGGTVTMPTPTPTAGS